MPGFLEIAFVHNVNNNNSTLTELIFVSKHVIGIQSKKARARLCKSLDSL